MRQFFGFCLFLGLLWQAHCRPLIIAHRGDSGNFPEHTLRGYISAVETGADYIELDVIADSDGMLWIRHENELSLTTNAKELFPHKVVKKIVDGKADQKTVAGVFSEDLKSFEMRQLKARQRFSFRSQEWNYLDSLLSVQDLVRFFERAPELKVGLYIETKTPEFFRKRGIPLEQKLVSDLRPLLQQRRVPIVFQSASLESLRHLKKEAPQIPRAILVGKKEKIDWKSYPGLASIIGVEKNWVLPFNAYTRRAGRPLQTVHEAHAHGMAVHVWTFRDEWWYRPSSGTGAEDEYRRMQELGVDGVFSDFPATAREAFSRH